VLLHDENFRVAQAGLLETIKDTTRKFVDSKEVQEAVDYEQKNPNASGEKLLQLHSMLSSSMHSEPKNKNCSSCGEPAVNRCSQCRVPVHCNPKCQTTHWNEHRKSCKTKSLDNVMHRAAALLQKIYLAFRRTTFKDQFTEIEDSGQHLIIHLKNSKSRTASSLPSQII
jgi:hypothetical protein